MTELEQLSVNVQRQIDAQNARIDNVLTKVDSLVEESKQQREDIRRLQDKQDEDRKELNAKIDALGTQIHDTWRQTMLGVGGMIVAVGALLVALLR